ncbi:MAG: protein kinase [Planctomycetia bacterium]|nr:protein kinase [Planctomycetia bacterium]
MVNPNVEKITVGQFLALLTTCNLLSPDELIPLHAAWPAARHADDAGGLARELVQQGKLTKYQAAALYQNKPKGLGIGEYVFTERLGSGGAGAVYLARHRRTGETSAVKVLLSTKRSSDALTRFRREAETALRLNHPGIVRALDAGESEGQHFIAMEYIDGMDLSTYVKKQGPLPLEQAVSCVVQAARALAYAHEQGIVHRDVKPANLMLSPDGTVKLLDLGLARFDDPSALGDSPADEGLTQTGQVMGTVDYMAPEQALHTRLADARADVYGLGCTFYRLVTGNIPFDGDSVVAKILAHRDSPIPYLRAFNSQIPAAVDSVLQQMLAKHPDSRYQTMNKLAEDLERSLTAAPWQPSTIPAAFALPLPQVSRQSDAQSLTFNFGPGGHADAASALSPVQRNKSIASYVVGAAIVAVLLAVGIAWNGRGPAEIPADVTETALALPLRAAVPTPSASPTSLIAPKPSATVVLSSTPTPPAPNRITSVAPTSTTIEPKGTPSVKPTSSMIATAQPLASTPIPSPTVASSIAPPMSTASSTAPPKTSVVVAAPIGTPSVGNTAQPLKPNTPTAPQADGWIDLLDWATGVDWSPRGIDWNDNLESPVTKQGLVLKTKEYNRFPLPAIIDGEYDMEVEFTRHAGRESVSVFFPVGIHNMHFFMGGYTGRTGGVDWIDGKLANDGNPTTKKPAPISNGVRHRVKIRVRRYGDEAAFNIDWDDTQDFITWRGPYDDLTCHEGGGFKLTTVRRPWLANWNNRTTFHTARIRMVSGECRRDFPTEADRQRDTQAGFTRLVDLNANGPTVGWGKFLVNQVPLELGPTLCERCWPLVSLQPSVCANYYAAHAPSRLKCRVPKGAKSFSVAGYNHASRTVKYSAYVDGNLVAESGVTDIAKFSFLIPPKSSLLELVIDSDGDLAFDHSYWCNPLFVSATGVKLPFDVTSNSVGAGKFQSNQIIEKWASPPLEPDDAVPCDEFLFAHAKSSVSYAIPPGNKRFTAIAYCARTTSVTYEVWADDRQLFKSPHNLGIIPINVLLPPNAKTIELRVLEGRDVNFDLSMWCYPRLYRK